MKNQMIRKRPENITLNRNLFWRYVSYSLASGIVLISREEIYHKIPKSFQDWMKKIPFLTSQELITCKRIYIGKRDRLTKVFNEASQRAWNPCE